MLRITSLLLLVIISLPLALGVTDLGYFDRDENANLVIKCELDGYVCTDVTCNISVQNPVGISLVNFQEATNNQNNFNYTLNTSQITRDGIYQGQIACTNATISDTEDFIFEVNGTGRPTPHGLIVLLFVGGFITILMFMSMSTILILKRLGVGSLAGLDFDIVDFGKTAGTYFALLGFFFLQLYYLDNDMITNITDVLVNVGVYTHLVIPGLLLALSMSIGALRGDRG